MSIKITLPTQPWLGYDPERGDLHGYTPEQMRELAERIVRECADIATVNAHQWQPPGHYVLQHFGVES